MEHYLQEMTAEYHELSDEDGAPLTKSCWNSESHPVEESSKSNNNNNNNSGGFECNICLDSVQDPVVTFCGHLYCWPCIYKWIHCETEADSSENPDHQEPQCPVCKAQVSEKTLVPLYGRSPCPKSSDRKATNFGFDIPQRPQSPRCTPSAQTPTRRTTSNSRPYPGSYMASPVFSPGGAGNSVSQPMVGMFGEIMYGRIFGNSETTFYTYPNSYNLASRTMSQRMRRRIMAVDRSLSRICFFLFCCMVLCLLLF